MGLQPPIQRNDPGNPYRAPFWQDIRFYTGDDKPNLVTPSTMRQVTNYVPIPPYIPSLPPEENNPDPGGEPGDINVTVNVDDSVTVTVIDGNGDPIEVGQAGDGLPDWFILTDEGDGVHKVEIDADTLLKILLQNLPTTDPGEGLVWLSDE